MRLYGVLMFWACLFCQGCAHAPAMQVNDMSMTLEKMENLPLGATSSEVEHLFGMAPEIYPWSPGRSTTDWHYPANDYNRMVFEIDNATHRVVMKFWAVLDGDPERKLEVALARYPHAHFKRRDSKVKPPHGGPGYAWYDDEASGVSIQFRKAKNTVYSIVWCKEDPKMPCRKE